MEEQTCKNCKHFVQHYAIVDGKLFDVWCGLCIHARGKHRKPDQRACEAFAIRKGEVPSEKYLTRVLLQYLMENQENISGIFRNTLL